MRSFLFFLGVMIALDASMTQAQARTLDVTTAGAPLAYQLSRHSPSLSPNARRSISQDFNGAPLAGAPGVHAFAAERVACRTRQPSLGKGTRCTLTFAARKEIALTGSRAKELYDAMGTAGVEAEAGMGHLERVLTGLSCTVDDKVAQSTPATGDAVAGFSCRFSVDP